MNYRHLIIAAFVGVTATALATVPTYRAQFLGANWTGTGLNERGDVCGSLNVDGTRMRAGISHGGQTFELLPLPPGMETSRAFDINDAGVIVGAVCPNMYVVTQPTAAVWRPTPTGYEVEVLGGLSGDNYSIAHAVNNVGDIIGASGFWGWNPDHPILYTEAGATPLPGGALAADVSDQRIAVAGPTLIDLNTGTVTSIPLPPGVWQGVQSSAINANGDFCGYIQGYSSCSVFPIRYRQGVGWEFLGGCAPTAASANAMNDHGDATTNYYNAGSGVDFVGDGYVGLGSLIDPSQGPWYVSGGNAINNAHQILAGGRQGASGPIGTVLLTPMNAVVPGDVDGDGDVDISDLALMLGSFGLCAGDAGFNASSDFDSSGCTELADLATLLAHFGA
ncbi:MAG: hypothetical protein HZB38_19005 [Planctomycetes bacterium]|nr:hypothetical protein [Planctomycetota bacterium]